MQNYDKFPGVVTRVAVAIVRVRKDKVIFLPLSYSLLLFAHAQIKKLESLHLSLSLEKI